MGTFYLYVRKFMSCCGMGIDIEEKELREPPLKDELRIILDNSISNDSYSTRLLVSRLRSDVSNFNESSWSSAEEMMHETHSESSLSCSQHKGLQFGSGINYDFYDHRKETESDLLPLKIAKEVYKQQNKQLAVKTSESLCSHLLSSGTTTTITSDANAVASVRSNRLSGNKADVYSSNMSTKEATSEESSLAISGRNSLLSLWGTTKNYDDDGSLKEKLTRPQKTSTETDPNPAKGKEKASKWSIKKAMRSLVNQNEKPTGESGSGWKKAHVHSSMKEVTSEKSLSASSRRKFLKSPCGKNNGGGDSLKEKLSCPKTTSLEPDSTPAKSSYVSKRKSKNASSSLVIQNAKPTGKTATSSCYEHQGSNSVTLLSNNATGRILAETDSWLNIPGSQKKKLVPHKICRNTESVVVERKIQGYCSSHKILLAGEGDFSFSACLARAFGSATNMVATSLNSEVYLQCYYKDAMNNISELRTRGCNVLHGVNATDMSNHKSITGLSFDRIIYNFPHCGDFSGTVDARRKNKNLVRAFMKNSAKLIKEDGEIHIRHKSNYFFRRWDLGQLASESGLVLIDETPFDASKFRGYNTKYGFEGGRFGSDYNFDCHPSCTYKFVLPK